MGLKNQAAKEASYTAIIERTQEGGYVAQCIEVPSAIAQGETVEEVTESITLALDAILKAKRDDAMVLVKTEKNHQYALQPIACC